MKKITILIILIAFTTAIFAKENPEILEIRKLYKKWQPFIYNTLENGETFYLYLSGDKYEIEKWSNKKLNDDNLFLSNKIIILENKNLGFFVYSENFSPSGDWHIVSGNYYLKSGNLFFVFWSMNTFQADPPVTVQKRLYFNKANKLIRKLKSVYKINTREEIDASFADRKVDYKIKLNEFGFYKYWKKE